MEEYQDKCQELEGQNKELKEGFEEKTRLLDIADGDLAETSLRLKELEKKHKEAMEQLEKLKQSECNKEYVDS